MRVTVGCGLTAHACGLSIAAYAVRSGQPRPAERECGSVRLSIDCDETAARLILSVSTCCPKASTAFTPVVDAVAGRSSCSTSSATPISGWEASGEANSNSGFTGKIALASDATAASASTPTSIR